MEKMLKLYTTPKKQKDFEKKKIIWIDWVVYCLNEILNFDWFFTWTV